MTVIGHGGIGKTRLAIQVSRAVLERFPDGVWLVDLAPLSDPEKVPQSAARALGIPVDSGAQALEALLDYIRSRQLLLVLDNCEHVIEACAQLVEAVLIECHQVKILATSRETLGTTGESGPAFFLQPTAFIDQNVWQPIAEPFRPVDSLFFQVPKKSVRIYRQNRPRANMARSFRANGRIRM